MLGYEGNFQHTAGEQRATPEGTVLPGTYRDSRWRHVRKHKTETQHLAQEISAFVDDLYRHKASFAQLAAVGASMQIIVQFLGDGQFGDTVPKATLARLEELGLERDGITFGHSLSLRSSLCTRRV
ncbi:MAG: hypothetical protein H0T56_15565 [Pseudaminobacter sp.]|nr:hypothetical protein [Pseudaminobacter sp.]